MIAGEEAPELYCVGKLKKLSPKIISSLEFLWLLSLFQDKESNICPRAAKELESIKTHQAAGVRL